MRKRKKYNTIFFHELFERYLIDKKLSASTENTYRKIFNNVYVKKILQADVSLIDNEFIRDIFIKMTESGTYKDKTPVLANMFLAVVTAMIRYAEKTDIIERMPKIYIPKNPVDPVRKVMMNNEISKIMTYLKERIDSGGKDIYTVRCLHDMMMFYILTGSRKSEISNMRWKNVDFDNKIVFYKPEQVKNRKPKVIILTKTLLNILRRRYEERREDTDYVFYGCKKPRKPFVIEYHFKKMISELGINKMPHSIRRNVGTEIFLSRNDSGFVSDYLHNTNSIAESCYIEKIPVLQKTAELMESIRGYGAA